MNYAEAVKLAKAGEEKGFNFLYEQTYRSKYYLALQYMKNEEAAKDVLQDAYIKAFSKLDMLEQPESFPGWLGTIVGNTAKNMLKKKNPMLFSDVAVDDTDYDFEYHIEDDNLENQPEIAYTRQETQELVHKLLDTLSEEQRLCILMFHIEGASIKEIASALDCSENTVKSRLKYGRDNLKVKAEELQKKGYKLYSIAPLPLLFYLLRTEEAYLFADGSLAMMGKDMAKHIFHSSAKTEGAGISGGAVRVAESSAKTVVKKGFLHTTVGKVTAVVAGLCIVGGAAFYGISQMKSEEPKPETEVTQEQPELVSEQLPDTESEPPPETESEQIQETEEEYETKEETADSGQTMKEVYAGILEAVRNQETGYDFPNAGTLTETYQYFLHDMDDDGIEELIVGAEFADNTFYVKDCRVYSCEKTESGYTLKIIDGDVVALSLYLAANGNGLFKADFSRGTGKTWVYRITVQNGALVSSEEPEYEFVVGDTDSEQFNNTNPLPEWFDISNQEGLNS